MLKPPQMRWLEQNLRFASGVAKAGPAVKASGERYASASAHLAMALHVVLDEEPPADAAGEPAMKQLAGLMDGLGDENWRSALIALRELVEQVPMLVEAPAFAAPNGMHDLPQILCTAYYGRTAVVDSGFAINYRRAIKRLHWLLFVIQAEWMLTRQAESDDEASRERIKNTIRDKVLVRINGAEKAEELEIPARLQPRITLTGRDLMPSPAAIVAAIGMQDDAPLVSGAGNPEDADVSPRARSFIRFVTEVHGQFMAESGLSLVSSYAPVSARYLAHMHALLHEVAPRLATGVMPCDRTPIVAPWYASIILAVRAYAHTLAHVLGVPNVADESQGAVAFTFFSLAALADPGVEPELAPNMEPRSRPITMRPYASLCAAPSKSMYLCSVAQHGPWWVLLRATLSGLSTEAADALADSMLAAAAQLDVVVRNMVMLCVLMHTQTGMRVVGRRDPEGKGVGAFPLAARVNRVKDPVCAQTPLDMLMTTYSGTSDLASLASDDLAFNPNAMRRQEHAWMAELSTRVHDVELPPVPPASPSAEIIAETVGNFCDALKAIGLDWLKNCIESQSDVPEEAIDVRIAVQPPEMLDTLARVSASHAVLHCGQWLSVAFAFAVELERHHQRTARPLLRSPLDNGLAEDRLKDEAWLRSHFCYLTEQALHSARHGGMWAAGAHLILAAWVATQPEDTDGKRMEEIDAPDDDGLHIFARAITPHSVRGDTPPELNALLLTPDWRRTVETRGWDSVVECARAFERALHTRNVTMRQAYADELKAQAERQAADKAQAAEQQAAELPLVEPPLGPAMPVLLAHSVDRQRAGAKAMGPGRFDMLKVPALDAPTDAAMERFRLKCREELPETRNQIRICSTAYAHGAAVAVLAVPCDPEDVDRERQKRKAGRLVSDSNSAKGRLIERLVKFAQGAA